MLRRRCPSQPERPGMNVLFVTADQWRGDCLSCLGHPAVRTPNLDRLAADGVLFERHFAQATPCGPSRASLHTGLYALNHRSITNGTPLDARHKTLASLVRGRRLRSGPVRLHRHQRRPAHPARGQPLAAHLRGRGARVSRRAAPARGGGGLSRSPGRAWLWPPDLRRGLRWRLPAAGPVPCGGQRHGIPGRPFPRLAGSAGQRAVVRACLVPQAAPAVRGAGALVLGGSAGRRAAARSGLPRRKPKAPCTRGSRPIWRSRSRARIGGCCSTRPASPGCARSISG